MAETPMIHAEMQTLLKRVGHITKDRKNDFHGFKFRGVEDALAALGAALRHEGIALTPSFRTENERTEVLGGGYTTNKGKPVIQTSLRGVLRLTAADGSFWESAGWGTEVDGEGKSGNKAMAAAFKYALFFGLSIPVEPGAVEDGDYDGDNSKPEPSARKLPNSKARDTLPPEELEALDLDTLRSMAAAEKALNGESAYWQQIAAIGKRKAGK